MTLQEWKDHMAKRHRGKFLYEPDTGSVSTDPLIRHESVYASVTEYEGRDKRLRVRACPIVACYDEDGSHEAGNSDAGGLAIANGMASHDADIIMFAADGCSRLPKGSPLDPFVVQEVREWMETVLVRGEEVAE